MDAEYCLDVAYLPSWLDSCLSSGSNGHAFEDIEWADSCLVNHPEHLNGDSSFLKDALDENLKNKPSSSAFSSDISMEQADADTKQFIHHQGTSDYVLPATDDADVFLSQILEGNVSENDVQDAIWPIYNCSTEARRMKDKNVISAIAKEGVLEASSVRRGSNKYSEMQIDSSIENMETRIEEGGRQEFLKRLEKALKAVSVHLLPSALGGSMASKVASVDNIIAKTRQLSMDRTTR